MWGALWYYIVWSWGFAIVVNLFAKKGKRKSVLWVIIAGIIGGVFLLLLEWVFGLFGIEYGLRLR
ncbi:hypothetical protein NSQ26_01360 [Bacillus sp. FSL W7-1360]